MKLFGQYLVEKNLITEEQLLEVIVEQLKQMPSLCEMVFEKKYLPTADILNVLQCQSEKGLPFKEACLELGLWSEKLSQELHLESEQRRIPLGQLLVSQKKMTYETLVHALDEYLASVEPEAEQATEKGVGETPTIPSQEETNVSDAIFSAEDLLPSEKAEALKGLFTLLLDAHSQADAAVFLGEVFGQISKGMHEVRGSARLLSAPKTEELVDLLEGVLEVMQNAKASLEKSSIESFSQIGIETVDSIVEIKNVLDLNVSEDSYFEVKKDQIDGHQMRVQALREQLGSVSGNDPSLELAAA